MVKQVNLEIVAMSQFPGMSDAKLAEVVALAHETSRALDGVGANIQPRSSQESLLSMAYRQILEAEKAAAGPKAWTSADLEKVQDAAMAFGKRGQDAPLKHRGEYVKKYGVAAYEAERAKWGASASNFASGKNPYKGQGLKKALKAEARSHDPITNQPLQNSFAAPKGPKGPNVFTADHWNVLRKGDL
jgi:hypothetical protein